MVEPGDGISTAYWTEFGADVRSRYAELADLCTLGREMLFEGSQIGFIARSGTEAAGFEAAVVRQDWPGGPWPQGASAPIHQVGLMIALQAGGHLGEMATLLRSGEVVWSLPLLARAVAENCARLYAIYLRPLLGCRPNDVTLAAMKQVFAAAYLELFTSGFSAVTFATETLGLDPTNGEAREQHDHAMAELQRRQNAFGVLFDPVSTDVSSKRALRLEGLRPPTMTVLLDEMTAWLWPDPSTRPPPQYRKLSGLAHASIDTQMTLFKIEDSPQGRRLTRSISVEHIDYLVLIAGLLFQRALARVTGFYGWPEDPLHRYSDELARVFPGTFIYGDGATQHPEGLR